MAGKVFIADIHDRDRVWGTFLVQQKQIPLNKNAKPYISMTIMDRTGSLEARVWDNVETISPLFESGDFVEVQGVALAYQGRLQIKVDRLKKMPPESVQSEDYLPVSPRDRGEMFVQLRALLEKIQNEALRSLILSLLDDRSFRESFLRTPAAKTIHHAYLGGLLEHTLAVVSLAGRVADLYPELDRDLLLAGAFFHDIGKIRELGHEQSFDYTDEGRLLGHIVMGASMLSEWAKAHPGLSPRLVLKITHMILSHHGSYEFGSPKRPKFAEAFVLNYLDELDSKVQAFREIALRDHGQKWSSYQKLFDRYLFLEGSSPGQESESPADPMLASPEEQNDRLAFRPMAEPENNTSINPRSKTEDGGVPLDLFRKDGQKKRET